MGAVTAEVASSSLVVPAILSKGVIGRDTENSYPRLNPTSVSTRNSRALPVVLDRLQEQALSLKLFIVDRVNVARSGLRLCMAQHFLDD